MTHDKARLLLRIRVLLLLFMAGLVVSGVTAFPLVWETRLLTQWLDISQESPPTGTGLYAWLATVRAALADTGERYPFLAYGTDWLAFAHLVIAVAFIGPLRDPVRNEWVVTFGLIACAAVIPFALIAGEFRGIPFYWRLIDCSFGLIAFLPLYQTRRYIQILKTT